MKRKMLALVCAMSAAAALQAFAEFFQDERFQAGKDREEFTILLQDHLSLEIQSVFVGILGLGLCHSSWCSIRMFPSQITVSMQLLPAA